MYPASGMKKGLRKALINKNISLYYKYDERAGIVYCTAFCTMPEANKKATHF
jgi:hypothetical protein